MSKETIMNHILARPITSSNGSVTRFGFRTFSLMLLSFILGSTHVTASPPTDWRVLLPSRVVPHGFYPGSFDVAHGNGTYVGVGGVGAIATSPDGLNWKPVLPGTLEYFGSVAFGGGIFVAGSGTISTSTNGVQWDHHPGVPIDVELFGIRYLNDLFVAIGIEYVSGGKPNGVLYTSADGLQWIRRLHVLPPDSQEGVYFSGVAYGNGRFLVVGYDYGSMGPNGIIYTSTDAVQWTPADPDPPLSNPQYIAFAGSGFVLFDSKRILTSADGASWQLRHELDGLDGTWIGRGMASVGNRVVCLVEQNPNKHGSPRVALASEDGISWSQTTMPGAVDWQLFSDSTNFFALAERFALSSPDGIDWTNHFTPYPLDLGSAALSDIVFGDNGFVAVGSQGTIITSGTGDSWEKRVSGTGQHLTDVIHAGSNYVAAGSGGALIHSSDGQTWTPANLGVTLWLGPLAYGSNRFVLLTRSPGNGFYWTADDGINWRIRFSEPLSTFGGFSSMAFGNGRFVAGGAQGAVAVSGDGIGWQRAVLSPPYEESVIGQVVFDGERFLGRSFDDGLLASADGVNWTTLNTSRFSAIGHGDGNLVAVRGVSTNSWGDVFSLIGASPDGAAWRTVAPFLFQENRRSLTFAYGAGRFVGVGRNADNTARLFISGIKPLLDLRLEAAKLMLRIDGAAGSNWTLQHSATLLNWQTVGPITLGTELLEIDVTPSTETCGFWRLAAP